MKPTTLTPDQMLAAMQIGMMLLAIVSMWVVNDARTRGKDGWTAFWWGFATLMALIVVLPLWLLMRPQKNGANSRFVNDLFPRAPLPNPRDATERDATPPGTAPSSTRSKICDSCGKFYLGNHEKCPHCGAAIQS